MTLTLRGEHEWSIWRDVLVARSMTPMPFSQCVADANEAVLAYREARRTYTVSVDPEGVDGVKRALDAVKNGEGA